jgi:hypothetical protein
MAWVYQKTWAFSTLVSFSDGRHMQMFLISFITKTLLESKKYYFIFWSEPQQLKKPHVVWWTQWGWKYGSIKSHEILCTHVFWWTQKPHVVWWTLKIIKGPSNHMRFWVHQNTWGFSRVVGPSKHMRFWEGKTLKTLIRVHQITWGFGSIKTHEVLKGEKLDFGPSNHMSFLGPSNHMRWWKMGKIWLGPSNHMSARKLKYGIIYFRWGLLIRHNVVKLFIKLNSFIF